MAPIQGQCLEVMGCSFFVYRQGDRFLPGTEPMWNAGICWLFTSTGLDFVPVTQRRGPAKGSPASCGDSCTGTMTGAGESPRLQQGFCHINLASPAPSQAPEPL